MILFIHLLSPAFALNEGSKQGALEGIHTELELKHIEQFK